MRLVKPLALLVALLAPSAVLAQSCTGQFKAGQVCGNSSAAQALPGATSNPVLGAAGQTVGTLGFRNVTSGLITLQPVAGALGSSVLSLPAITDTVTTNTATAVLQNKTIDTAQGNVLKINGNTLAASAGTATVTIPNSSTMLAGLAFAQVWTEQQTFNQVPILPSQSAHLLFAGPPSGSPAAPSFRTLVNADFPVGSANTVKGTLNGTTIADIALPACSTATSALSYTLGSGFGCNNISLNSFRPILASNVTYFVASTAVGAQDCTSSGNACTLSQVYAKIKALDLNGNVVTVQLADGIYSAPGNNGIIADGPFVGDGWEDNSSGSPHVIFQGNAATPTNVEITSTTGPCFQAQSYARIGIRDMWLRCVYDVYSLYHGEIFVINNVVFDGVSVANSMGAYATRFGYIDFSACRIIDGCSYNATFSWLGLGTPDALWNATHSGNIRVGGTWNAGANRTFAIATAYAEANADITFWNTTTFNLGAFSVTGKRFEVDANAVIQYVPGTLTTLPGSLPGTQGNGGVYYFTFDAFVGRFWSNTIGTTTSADLASGSRYLQLSGESAFTGGSGAFINLYSSTNSINPSVACIGTNSTCSLDVLASGGVIAGSHGDPGANNFGAGGTIDAVGTISSSGPVGGFIVKRRDTAANAWTLYSAAGSLQINDGSADRIVVANGGVATFTAGTASTTSNTGTIILSGVGGLGVGGNVNVGGFVNVNGTIGATNLIATGGAAGGFFMANRATGSTNWVMYNDANIVRWNDGSADRLTLSASSLGLNVPLTYGGVTLSNAVTGTGNMVLSASPTLSGTLTAAAITASGAISFTAGTASTTSGTGAVVLSGSGGLGVGGNVNVNGTIGAANLIATSGAAGGFFMANRATGSTNWIMYNDANIVRWNDGGTDRVSLSSSLFLVTTPSTFTAAHDVIYSGTSGYLATFQNTHNTDGDLGIRVAAGPTGAGTATVLINFFNGAATEQEGSITRNGAAVAYNTTSDERVKRLVSKRSHWGLSDLMKIETPDYTREHSPNVENGYFAQQLATVYPIAVTPPNPNGPDDPHLNPWSVDYGRVTPLIITSVQELAHKVGDLKAANDNLRREVDALRKSSTLRLGR